MVIIKIQLKATERGHWEKPEFYSQDSPGGRKDLTYEN